ncbi:MAG: SMC-Scp complex subunit ScpB [Pelagibacterales bacterium]|nr:SMC-Scp complex subunit ScpB [Pelagibacterales bacterium]|tara:strand:- start:5413 stop:5940 length:528 start_codon:yes stop_codon:yes gene_type:complete
MNYSKPLSSIIESALLVSHEPLTLQEIANLFDSNKPSKNEIRKAIEKLNEGYKNNAYEIVLVASGYRIQVKSGFEEWVGKLNKQSSTRYSKAFLETLVIIAYKQPVTRGDIEEIRGVSVNPQIIRNLIEFEWIKVIGHKESPGKPELLATTKKFLDYFNLQSISELPPQKEIEAL